MNKILTIESSYEEAEKNSKKLVKNSGFKNQKILVKPNLLCPTPPEAVATTHPSIVKGVVEYLIDKGCDVYLGDSSAGQDSLNVLLKKTKIKNALKKLDVTFVEVDKYPAIELQLQGFIKDQTMPISKIVNEVDGIISLPKYKVHMLTGFTGATKNFYGLAPRLVKKEFHAKYINPAKFSTMIVDLALSIMKKVPTFYVMDSIWGMEGEGPKGGTKKEINMLIAGKNPFQVDNFAIGMVNPKFKVFTNEIAQKLGLIQKYEVIGPKKKIKLKMSKGYKAVRLASIFPNFGILASLVGIPKVGSLCTGCQTCIKNCPVNAIHMENGKAVIDRKKCIKCFTCVEVCPVNAIKVRKRLI